MPNTPLNDAVNAAAKSADDVIAAVKSEFPDEGGSSSSSTTTTTSGAAKITGNVRTSYGKAITNGTVALYSGTTLVAKVGTDPSGNYAFTGAVPIGSSGTAYSLVLTPPRSYGQVQPIGGTPRHVVVKEATTYPGNDFQCDPLPPVPSPSSSSKSTAPVVPVPPAPPTPNVEPIYVPVSSSSSSAMPASSSLAMPAPRGWVGSINNYDALNAKRQFDPYATGNLIAKYLADLGMKGNRGWFSFVPRTGKPMWNINAFLTANVLVALGVNACVTIHPDMTLLADMTATTFNVQALFNTIVASCDKRVTVQLGNEVNQPGFFKGGAALAFTLFKPLAKMLRAAGYVVISPSVVYGDDNAGLAKGLDSLSPFFVDYGGVDVHVYSSSPVNFTEACRVANLKITAAGARPVSTEFGIDTYNANSIKESKFIEYLLQYVVAVRTYFDFAYYFCATPHKEPAALYLLNPADNSRRPLYAAMKAALSS